MLYLNYDTLKKYLELETDLVILESTYLGNGILGRFFPPNIILVDTELCDSCNEEKQKKVLVLLHEVCHWLKWKEHVDDFTRYDEEACFEFEIICDEVLNEDVSIDEEFEAIKRLDLQEPVKLLKKIINEMKQ